MAKELQKFQQLMLCQYVFHSH